MNTITTNIERRRQIRKLNRDVRTSLLRNDWGDWWLRNGIGLPIAQHFVNLKIQRAIVYVNCAVGVANQGVSR
jgi:hypothetical protein